MNRFAEIKYGRVHSIFETHLSYEDITVVFSPTTLWVDITGQSDVVEGYLYNGAYFTAPVVSTDLTADEIKQANLDSLDLTYERQFEDLKRAWAAAMLNDNTDLIAELKNEYSIIKAKYDSERQSILNGLTLFHLRL